MELEEIINYIEGQTTLSFEDSFSFAKICSSLLRNKPNEGRKLIIYILDNYHKISSESKNVWIDLVEAAGFYPYLDKEDLLLNNFSSKIRKELHFSKNLGDKYFHEEQRYLKQVLDSGKNLIVSAPTSFGKSLLIEEVVSSKKFRNIVVIQPTLALLDETRKKFKKYKQNYKIIIRTSQEPSTNKGNLFLLTAERVMEYVKLPHIDFFVIDEFYKLSAQRDDERSDVLNNAFYKLLKQPLKSQFYLLGPNIDGISQGFESNYNAIFYKTDYSLIENKTIDIYSQHEEKFSKPRKFKDYKESVLFDLLLELKHEQTIIYCSSPGRVRELAQKFCIYLKDNNISKGIELPLVEWIKLHVNPEWNLIDFINHEIGINDGALQKHINSSMIDYFNESKLKYIFCTSTIIEGVNTSAKNVIFFDKVKGKSTPIDYFDYSNIKGRSGRMMIHYIGRIFNFNPSPNKDSQMIVDIPFYQQNPIKNEVLNGLNDKDIKKEVKEGEQYQKLQKIPKEHREMFQRNGVLIEGQKKILELLSNPQDTYTIERNSGKKEYTIYELISWNTKPTYDQIQFIVELCWSNLTKPTETLSPMTQGKLVKIIFDYMLKKDIFGLISSEATYQRGLKSSIGKTDSEVLNDAIKVIFNISRHWFQYKVPKWLSVINNLQTYVCEQNGLKPGNYTYFVAQIENGFIPQELVILSEYGIPTSAINKIKNEIDLTNGEQQILNTVSDAMKNNNTLLEYERDRIKTSL